MKKPKELPSRKRKRQERARQQAETFQKEVREHIGQSGLSMVHTMHQLASRGRFDVNLVEAPDGFRFATMSLPIHIGEGRHQIPVGVVVSGPEVVARLIGAPVTSQEVLDVFGLKREGFTPREGEAEEELDQRILSFLKSLFTLTPRIP